jgi:hypothetical protein
MTIDRSLVVVSPSGLAPASPLLARAAQRDFPPEELPQLHQRYADAWRCEADPDQAALGHHLLHAGRLEEAARHAGQARAHLSRLREQVPPAYRTAFDRRAEVESYAELPLPGSDVLAVRFEDSGAAAYPVVTLPQGTPPPPPPGPIPEIPPVARGAEGMVIIRGQSTAIPGRTVVAENLRTGDVSAVTTDASSQFRVELPAQPLDTIRVFDDGNPIAWIGPANRSPLRMAGLSASPYLGGARESSGCEPLDTFCSTWPIVNHFDTQWMIPASRSSSNKLAIVSLGGIPFAIIGSTQVSQGVEADNGDSA